MSEINMNEHDELENELNIFYFCSIRKEATGNQQHTLVPEKIFSTFVKLFTILYVVDYILHV